MIKLQIGTTIYVNDNITEEELKNIKKEFEDVAWENNMTPTQPTVKIEIIDNNKNTSYADRWTLEIIKNGLRRYDGTDNEVTLNSRLLEMLAKKGLNYDRN